MSALNGQSLQRASLVVPRWGIWWADVQTTEAAKLSGAATLEIGGLQLTGTIVDGDVYREAGWYRVVGGAAGWRKVIEAKGYRNEAGVKLSTVLQDAASACGETLGTILPTPIGPAFSRPKDVASRVLDELSEGEWYVDNDGVTQLGVRPAAAFEADYSVIDRRPDGGYLLLAAEDISTLVPGAQLEEIEVSSVRHELTAGGLRSHVRALIDGDQQSEDLQAIVRAYTAHLFFQARFEYRVTKAGDGYLDLRPMRTTQGLPDLANVPQRAGIPGGGGEPQLGSTVLVGFVDGDPTRPYVCDYDGQASAGWIPTKARLDASVEVAIGESAGRVLIAGGAQNLALANLTNAQFDALATLFNSHTHEVPALGTSDPPGGTFSPSDVDAAKVKGT